MVAIGTAGDARSGYDGMRMVCDGRLRQDRLASVWTVLVRQVRAGQE